jgi:site-specific recombinase
MSVAAPLREPSAALPDVETFGRLVAPGSPRHRSLRQLHAALEACRPGADSAARAAAVEGLAGFLRGRRAAAQVEGALPGEGPQVLRLRLFLRALELVPPYRQRVAQTLARLLEDSLGGGLFGRLGLPTDRGFLAETIDRVSQRFLPEPRDDRDLGQLVGRLFPGQAELGAILVTPPESMARLVTLLRDPASGIEPWLPLSRQVADAIALLATRISAVGLSDVIRARSPEQRLIESPFFKLPRACDAVLAAAVAGSPDVEARVLECRELAGQCRAITRAVVQNLEQYGVSVDVVYRLELITKSLSRLELLIDVLLPGPELERAARVRRLLSELVRARLRDRGLGEILRGNLHLLARKIIERAGHTGEHYITSSRSEYLKMLLSAGGGGVLTAGTTGLKYLIGWAHFAPFVEGMASAANYAGSFILMQLLGFTLATKQPSMTAAALAGTLRESAGHPDLSKLVAMIARITRSQLAAAIGNIGLVIPAAFAVDAVWRARTGSSFLDAETANYVLHSLHPTQSGTVFFAALTGVLLWSSSIVAGWVENWAVYRRLPDAIADHRLGRWVGRRTMALLSRLFSRNIAGFGGNGALGVFLGMTPVMGKFFGLPLDVRHVTLSTGALTLSACALGGDAWGHPDLPWAALGIAVIGSLNFGVSFVLALAVALRAREVERADRLRLLLSVIATFLRSPLQFVFPPAADGAVRVHGPVSVPPPPA